MRALLAFDKFKDALTARQACEAAAAALRTRQPDWQLDLCPLADGGEGFAEILTRAAGGHLQTISVEGPRGESVEAAFGLVPLENIPPAARTLLQIPSSQTENSTVAIIEMASASGLALLPPDRRDPWQTSSRGTGELIRTAAEQGVSAILLGVGGSATNDPGLGALAELGLKFHTAAGELILVPAPGQWSRLARIEGAIAPALPPVRIACDVSNPLLGPRGCAAVYGPQKGLAPADHARLEHASARLALMLSAHCGQPDTLMDLPGAGAAGGIAFGLMTAVGATLLPGSDLVSAWLDLDARITAADLVLTGEGRFDDSSLSGKGPGTIVSRAIALGKPAHVFAGAVAVSPRAGLHLHSISPAGLPLADALRTAGPNLAAAVARAL